MGLAVFRFDLGGDVGGGHYSRCEILAKFLSSSHEIKFAIKIVGSFDSNNFNPTYPYLIIPSAIKYDDECNYLIDKFGSIEVIFFDFTHEKNLLDVEILKRYFDEWHGRAQKTVLLDGIKAGSIAKKIGADLRIGWLVQPYIGAELQAGKFTHLYGPKYFAIPPNMRRVECKSISHKEVRVLITFGQSDPYDITLFAISGILLKPNLRLRIIVGPHFSVTLKAGIESLRQKFPNKIEVVNSPLEMSEHYLWADIAIAGTGLSKYELAFFGVPSILISGTRLDAELQKDYDKKEVAIHIGMMDDLKCNDVSVALSNLIEDKENYKKYFLSCMELIDGEGCVRIIESLSKTI